MGGVDLMGWSSETYRYKQYKNALKYINEQKRNREQIDFTKPIEPREDFNLQKTLIESLKETIMNYEAVTVLEQEDENNDKWYVCSECGTRISPYWKDAPEEWNFCPTCGSEFKSEHILAEMNVHIKKCERCGHLCTSGYEYPESFCELGIDDLNQHYDGEGCSYTTYQRKEICKRVKNDRQLWWDENED